MSNVVFLGGMKGLGLAMAIEAERRHDAVVVTRSASRRRPSVLLAEQIECNLDLSVTFDAYLVAPPGTPAGPWDAIADAIAACDTFVWVAGIWLRHPFHASEWYDKAEVLTVQFTAPSGYVFTTANVGSNDAIDSDANTSTGKTGTITVISNQTDNTNDAGLYQPAALGDFVWEDLNANGLQDTGEPAISGVTVQLLNSSNVVIGTTTTNASGIYSFTNLAPGSYTVQFTAPSGYTFTTANVGSNDAIDSDANISTGKTGTITLVSGQTDNTNDAGFYRTATIGDFVWKDTNGNGLQDTGEPGISGMTVQLLNSLNVVIATTTTNASGIYTFTGLVPGSYTVQFTAPSG